MASSAAQHWIDGANRYPLLTPAQEIHLSRQVRAWLDFPGGPDAAPPNVQRIGKRARQRLILSNLRLIAKVAQRFVARIAGTPLSFEDLVQEGVIGLSRAAEKFDPSAGYRFSTYAYWWITQAIQRHCEQQSGVIRLPGGPLKLLRRWTYRPPGQTLEQFAEQEQVPVERARECLRLAQNARGITSLDKKCKTPDDSGSNMADFVASDDTDLLDVMDVRLAIEALAEAYPADLAMLELAVVDQAKFKDIAELNGHQSSRRAQREVEQAKARLELVAHMHYGRLTV